MYRIIFGLYKFIVSKFTKGSSLVNYKEIGQCTGKSVLL